MAIGVIILLIFIMQESIELLAPAKNLEIAKAAILAGADAIFIGASDFGARVGAKNSIDDLKELCTFAHMFNVKVHVTLNTLLYDDELKSLQEIIYKLDDAKVDAIIFQDLSLTSMDIPKGIELHASTQCDITTKDRFLFYKNLGVSQVVLPREISLNEIKELKSIAGNVKLEVFVAGAICVGESGICYISEYLTKRSANRGACAQICRLPMGMYDKDHKKIADGHLISMKDNFMLDDMDNLIEAGARSFKIEGRLKDKDFVVNMVSLFSKKINSIISKSNGKYIRGSKGKNTYNFIANPFKTFNRGFTHAMINGNNEHMVNIKSPKSQGEFIGFIDNVLYEKPYTIVRVKLANKDITITNNDGFIYNDNGIDNGFMCNKANPYKKGFVDIYIHSNKKIRKGLELYRNEDVAFKKLIFKNDAYIKIIPLLLYIKKENDNLLICYEDEMGICGKAFILNKALNNDIKYLDANKVINKASKLTSLYHEVIAISANSLNQNDKDKLFNAFYTNSDNKKCNVTDFINFYDIKLYMPMSLFNETRYKAFDDYLLKKGRVNANFKYENIDAYPQYPEKYIDERLILNKICKDIYIKCGVDINAKAPKIVSDSVMTCKNCLVKNHALCKKDGGKTAGFYIKIGDNRFDIVCDCVACKMHLMINKE